MLFRRARQRVIGFLSRGKVQFGPKCDINFGTQFLVQTGTITIGRRAHIRRGSIIHTYGGDITIGNNFSLNPYAIIYGPGRVLIGNDVRVAAHVTIVASNHNFDDPSRTIKSQGNSSIGITIGNDVWIGANCVILDGAKIADGCVIAAGSVVRGETVTMGIYAGVPAKLKRLRGQNRSVQL